MLLSRLAPTLALLALGLPLVATETEHHGLAVLPAPGPVAVDGQRADWDLTGGIFAVCDVENLRDQYGVWFHAMYDAENLYILARWNDPAPLNNPGSSKGDYGFAGDCLQFRLISHFKGQDGVKETVSHWTCWRDRDGIAILDVAYGRDFKGPKIRNAEEQGARQAFLPDPGGKGYAQEIAIPWKLLTSDGKPIPAGGELRLAIEPNYTAGVGGRVSIKDSFQAGVALDRVFTFTAADQWGTATLLKTGAIKPRDLRLADGRTFVVRMQDGLPKVDWSGLIAVKELPGFKPLTFTVPEDGYVSLNLYRPDGSVARQLLNWAFYTKGEHTVKWDGLETNPAWRVPGAPVASGSYAWKALWHPGIGLRLRGWASNAGSAPWDNGPTTNWGGDHGAAEAVASDGERLYLGWGGAEAGKALVATDLDGAVQWRQIRGGMGGAGLIGVDGGIVYAVDHQTALYRVDTAKGAYSNFTGRPVADVAISEIWGAQPTGMPDRVEGMDAKGGKLFLTCTARQFRRQDVKDWKTFLGQIAGRQQAAKDLFDRLGQYSRTLLGERWGASGPTDLDEFCKAPIYYIPDLRDDVIRVLNELVGASGPAVAQLLPDARAQANRAAIEASFPGAFIPLRSGFLAVLDGASAKPEKFIDLDRPRHVTAASAGLVYVVAADGTTVLQVDVATGTAKALISGLREAQRVALGPDGRIFVSVRGESPQVLVFSPAGTPVATIGRKGGRPAVGPWVKDGLRHPAGLVVDRNGRLWVAESTMNPKRISVWDAATGAFIREFFGPTQYGASGGAINPRDPGVMFGEGCEWRLDPKTGRDACLGVITESASNAATYAEYDGRLYVVENAGRSTSSRIWERLGDGRFALRAAIRNVDKPEPHAEFWADADGDGAEQPAEVASYPNPLGITGYLFVFNVGPDLTIYARDEKAKTGWLLKPVAATACGAPVFNLAKDPAATPKLPLTGGNGAMLARDGKTLFAVESDWIRGFDTATGGERWRYPNTYSGVHGSHNATPPEPGLLRGAFGPVGTARLPEPVGDIWAVNGNCGEWYVFTRDGFFLTQLFQGDAFKMRFPDQAIPGAILDAAPPGLGGEDFGGSLVQGADGKVYIQAGKTGLWNLAVSGLEAIKALPGGSLTISEAEVGLARTCHDEQLQAASGAKKCIAKRATPAFTGDLAADFKDIEGVTIDKQGVRVRAVMAWDDQAVHLGWEVRDDTPWINGADAPAYLYARGDTVDFQLGTDPKAAKDRADPGKGDLRLSIGNFQGKPVAVIYRKVAERKQPKTFSSGVVKAYEMDAVEVLAEARIAVKVDAAGKRYVVEASIPRAALGLAITGGLALSGDFGATFSDKTGGDTALRVHWNNQQTGLVNDEVFELMMTPKNWGEITFKE